MEQKNRAREESLSDAIRDTRWIVIHAIVPTRAPPQHRDAKAPCSRMHKAIRHPHRRTKADGVLSCRMPERRIAPLDLPFRTPRIGGPKPAHRVSVRMIPYRMPGPADRLGQLRPLLHLSPLEEEGRTSSMSLQHLQHRARIRSEGAIVDRQPDFALIGRKALDHIAKALGIGTKRTVNRYGMGEDEMGDSRPHTPAREKSHADWPCTERPPAKGLEKAPPAGRAGPSRSVREQTFKLEAIFGHA